ncbi:MAG: hypothetical protein JW748_05665 [Anaerolineales bacterium]|nr:hypothetical protein [Anaerolineales bacterium]
MTVPQSLISPVPVDSFSDRATRAWWTDGLWELAMAGFWAITALWLHPLVQTLAFPSWTWPWPFITEEHINPLRTQIALWVIGLFFIWMTYIFLARLLVDRMKRRLVAPRLGDVRHKFFLPVGRSFGLIFFAVYVLGCAVLTILFWKGKGGPHLFSVFGIASFAGAMYLVGRKYDLRRFRWVSIVGSVLCVTAEMLTTHAVYLDGPKNFMDVSPLYGNPSLICLIWAGMIFLSGFIALRQTLGLPHAEA